ncbi:MAG: acyl-CoA dehydrogenase family protein [Bacteroidota bacterium]
MKQYYFTEEHELFRESIRSFLEKEVTPFIDEWEENRHIPRSIFKKFGEMGYFGLMFPEKYGGLDLDFFYTVVLLEELVRPNSGGFNAAMGSHSYLALNHINAQGSEAQKEKYLQAGISGDLIGALAITEPGAGSDVAGIKTTARKEGDEYVINGSKIFITNGVNSDFLVVAAKTKADAGAQGISMFIVDRDSKGLSASNIEKLGWHASDTGDIALDEVRVPASNLLGEENQGFFYIMHHFALERLIMAIGGVASSDLALEKALKYMSEREAFGRPINKFQALRHKMSFLASEIEVQRAFAYDISKRYDKGEYVVKEAAMAKLLATELALKASDQCLQMFGGYGFTEEFPMARMYRDNRLGPIGGGSSEIMREIISKMIIDSKSYDSVLEGKAGNGSSIIQFSEEHELFRQSLRDFLKKEVEPNIEKWEADRRTPKEIWKKMGDMGFLGLGYPSEYGGKELDFLYDVVFNEELALMNSQGFAIAQQVTQYMSSTYLMKYGSKKLKAKYLPGIISGEMVSSIGITEPSAGSDAANIKTRAVREGDYYIVNGSKTFITNGVYGDFIVTVVKTDPEKRAAGVSLLVIDRHAEGVSARKIKKLGWWASDTAELSFDNVKVPVENLVGDEGQGFYYLMNGLQLERIISLPAAIVAMEQALSMSIKYLSEREAFGKPLDKFQVLRHRIAQLSAEVESLKSFSYQCARLYADNVYDVKLCSIAKLLVAEKTNEVANKCIQFFGGYGFTEAFPLARFYRDCRVGTIGGGSSEVMLNILSKMIIDDVGYEAAKSSYKVPTSVAANGSNGNGSAHAQNGNGQNLEGMVKAIQKQAAAVSSIGNTLKFDFGDNQLLIDGSGDSNVVSTDNMDADCTVSVGFDDFQALIAGKLNPMNAMMSGKMKIDGDMGVAMKLQSLFG